VERPDGISLHINKSGSSSSKAKEGIQRLTVAAGVGKVNFWCTMKYFLSGMTKKTPKNPADAVRAMSLPISFVGSDRSSRRYIAGTALTNRIPRPPEARKG